MPGDTDHVFCDAQFMETALKNLLYNPARFARRDVRVTFVGHNAVNQLIVDDDGPGIPEKERKRVFESFVQLDNPQGRNAGFGLGLICATWPTSAARA